VDSSPPTPTPLLSTTYASLGRRLAAHVFDVLIAFSVLLLTGIFMRVLRGIGLWMPSEQAPEQTWQVLGVAAKCSIVLSFVLSMGPIYFVLWEASAWQATFGKRLLNIYVTSADRTRISLPRAVGRWCARWVCGWFGGDFISAITIVSTGNKQALHDFLADTLVLSGRPLPGGCLEPWRIAAGFGIPFVWLLGTFLATL
jgi:uncharacterized RDD family membrane protein YckC